MPTGVMLRINPSAANAIDGLIADARRAHDIGVKQIWLAQQADIDAIAAAGLIGAAVPGLGVGTAVVPINPRHPLVISAAAQTAQAAAHGNFTLGLGLGARVIEHYAFGIDRTNTVNRLHEYLQVLRGAFERGDANFRGAEYSIELQWPVQVAGGTPIPIYVAAMGPKALRITGEYADGTLPYLAGPRTLSEFIVPTINDAAEAAGRPQPRVTAMVPVVLSDDAETARRTAAEQLAFYATIPSYQKVIAREGISDLTELAALGSPDQVREKLQSYLDAGATDVVLSPLQVEQNDLEELWAVAASL
ncbi:LLM class F420-dependent oxidoreductase [Mycolicibacterium smegmatis]|nr:LLM class F420-dependent oxidoreductase [Mycolicibacterium smegmatis]AFP42020.1 Luciferase-like protein [Mycolicibacterium smegmatis MC2 155]AIU10746.1 F420-dependent oxidoreductase [Mycolicibacterium smegmatis MC2 155]AIU17371.1 F420-dependent oxidoreductase [Mycolicibacterium smegmatis]AIU23994.1 F420-dependent oxidoreductase [Mycolicibacterium smegmatis]MBE9617639.1 LLM class F420-dependent oxidoreductase [Mycolicibacterium smegmatis]